MVLEGSLSDWEEVVIVALAPVLFYVFVNDLVTESTCLLMEFADNMVFRTERIPTRRKRDDCDK